jgi:hypothetical protein
MIAGRARHSPSRINRAASCRVSDIGIIHVMSERAAWFGSSGFQYLKGFADLSSQCRTSRTALAAAHLTGQFVIGGFEEVDRLTHLAC